MKSKSKQLSRIRKVQAELRKGSEMRLARLNVRRTELQSIEAALLESLASSDPHHMALAPLAGSRLRALDQDLKHVETQRAAAETHWRDMAQRSLVADRLEKAARAAERQVEDRKSLEDLLGEVESRRTSLP